MDDILIVSGAVEEIDSLMVPHPELELDPCSFLVLGEEFSN